MLPNNRAGAVGADSIKRAAAQRGSLGRSLKGMHGNLADEDYTGDFSADEDALLRRHMRSSDCATRFGGCAVVQKRLGHKKIEMTLNLYAHVLPSMQADAASRLAVLLHG